MTPIVEGCVCLPVPPLRAIRATSLVRTSGSAASCMPLWFWLFVRAALAVRPVARLLGRIDHRKQVHEDVSVWAP